MRTHRQLERVLSQSTKDGPVGEDKPVTVSTLAHGRMTLIRIRSLCRQLGISTACARESDAVHASVQAFVPRADGDLKAGSPRERLGDLEGRRQ